MVVFALGEPRPSSCLIARLCSRSLHAESYSPRYLSINPNSFNAAAFSGSVTLDGGDGSDSLTVTEPHFRDPAIKANCVARKDGDFFVINGQKSAWVSNGTHDKLYLIMNFNPLHEPGQGNRGAAPPRPGVRDAA